MIIGPAVEQALTLFSSEVGEGRRVTDTVVSIHNGEKEDEYSHKPSAALTLPASTPVTLSVPPMRVISQLHRSVDPIPPFKAVSRRRDLNVVNKTSLTKVDHSPNLETARKQSHPPSTPMIVDGGGQLTRAAAYIRERSIRRSPAFDEFVRQNPKAPPDKVMERDRLRHIMNDGPTERAKASKDLPISDVVTSPSNSLPVSVIQAPPAAFLENGDAPPLPVISKLPVSNVIDTVRRMAHRMEAPSRASVGTASLLPETLRANERLTKRSKSTPKFTGPTRDTSNIGVQKGRTVQLVEAVEADRCSAERLVETEEVS